MKEIFKNKRICFLGDSITHHGYYIANMRWFVHNQKEKCIFFNRGIGGNRADMAEYLFEKEVVALNPDFCFFSFGCNDMGIWLYDCFKQETETLLAERMQRNQRYFDGIRTIIQQCKARDVRPVIMTPYPVNELLEEKPDIPTLGDNKEKAELIGPWFYKKRTFQKINAALKIYGEKLREIATEENCLFVDLYTPLNEVMHKEKDVFAVDGIHYTPKGHSFIAKILLAYLGYEDIPKRFESDEVNEEISRMEANQRNFAYVLFNVFHPCNGVFSEMQILKKAKEEMQNENNSAWKRGVFAYFLANYNERENIEKEILRKIEDYLR